MKKNINIPRTYDRRFYFNFCFNWPAAHRVMAVTMLFEATSNYRLFDKIRKSTFSWQKTGAGTGYLTYVYRRQCNGQEEVLVVHEVLRALALSIVHFNTTEYQQVSSCKDQQYTATQIHNYYHRRNSVTRNGHFELEDLTRALHYYATKKALQTLCPTVFEYPFEKDQSSDALIDTEQVISFKLGYHNSSYKSTIDNLKLSLGLGIGDVPRDVIYTSLYDKLISKFSCCSYSCL